MAEYESNAESGANKPQLPPQSLLADAVDAYLEDNPMPEPEEW